jgi:hypothetical protein
VRVKVAARLKQCELELHPEKTKVVYYASGKNLSISDVMSRALLALLPRGRGRG